MSSLPSRLDRNETAIRWRDYSSAHPTAGFSLEWISADRLLNEPFIVPRSPRHIELWLNLGDPAQLESGPTKVTIAPNSSLLFTGLNQHWQLSSNPGDRPQIVVARFSVGFLLRHLRHCVEELQPPIQSVMKRLPAAHTSPLSAPITLEQHNVISGLGCPPLPSAQQRLWYVSRAFELMVGFLSTRSGPDPSENSSGGRGSARVERVKEILSLELSKPPSLPELARLVGCSPYYLSRQFRAEMGITILQFVQHTRLDRAWQMLQSGSSTVGAAAAAVGYHSLSHFSTAFRARFGCPPKYLLTIPSQTLKTSLSSDS